ncbi:MAG TPA: AmmeMemoRadiSam system protein A [Polyangiaceae bacterium]|nr:AmmeMemoRadiSam system protein A [Polyangiaceae bacterium]
MDRVQLKVVAAVVLLAAGCPSCKRERAGGSGDLATDSGYVSPVAADFQVGPEEKTALLRLARNSVETFVRTGTNPPVPEELAKRWPHLNAPRACFVTLRVHGELRGCIGSLEPRRPLLEDIRSNAVSAAVHDTRFHPVSAGELGEIDYEISILDVPRPLQGVPVAELPAWLGQHKPGLIIEYRGRRSTFLPSVWEDLPEPLAFLEHLCRKQGSPADCWRDPSTRMSVYGSIKIAEKERG